MEKLEWIATAFANSRHGILITDSNGTILDVNPTFTAVTGYERHEIIGQNPRILHSGLHDASFYETMWKSLLDEGAWHGEISNRRKDGEIVVELLAIHAIYDEQGVPKNYIGNFANLTRFKAHESQMERMAHYDALTQLPNRVLLADRIRQSISWVQRLGTLVALCYVDLDGFKAINDRRGHRIGDQVLVEVAQRMHRNVRDGDTVARIGGDEFVLLLSDVDNLSEIEIILTRIIESLAEPFTQVTERISASIGVALYPEDATTPQELLDHADQAMYRAKQERRGMYYLFDKHQDLQAQYYREGIAALRQAINGDELRLYFQPIIDLGTGETEGLEATIRWMHAERGLLLPEEFVPDGRSSLEESALTIELDLWAIENALKQMALWERMGLRIPVSVRISMRLLHWQSFIDSLATLLHKYPASAGLRLDLEVGENAALADIVLASQVIQSCHKLGVTFSLDDFGDGHSSLTSLKILPAEVLKIAPVFIAGMLSDAGDMAVVESIIAVAKAFNRHVMAKNVDSADQARALQRRGCMTMQGRGIAPPMPASKVAAWHAAFELPAEWATGVPHALSA